MFTKNFYKSVLGMDADATGITISKTGLPFETASDAFISNDTIFELMDYVAITNNAYTSSSDASYIGVRFGSSTDPASIDAFSSGPAYTEFNVTVQSGAIVADDNGVSKTNVYTITNTSNEDMVIGSVSISNYIKGTESTSTPTSTYHRVLLEYTVLDEPKTIPAGGVGQIAYTIRLNYPTA